jgi:hypothetical protein
LTEWVNRRIGWDKLPWPLGLLVVLGLRLRLRAKLDPPDVLVPAGERGGRETVAEHGYVRD